MIHHGDCLEILRTLPSESVHCCVTSPPYWGLRDYGVDGQLGLEKSPEEYVSKMVDVFREVRRVLRGDGTLWLNIGDSYGCPAAGRNDGDHRADGRPGGMSFKAIGTKKHVGNSIKPKDLVGIPWRLAFALQSDGWYLRQDIIWHKPNPMPESVRDRCTKAHEYVFLMSKSARYWWDAGAVKEEAKYPGDNRAKRTDTRKQLDPMCLDGGSRLRTGNPTGLCVNRRSVWTVATQPCKEAHFAVMPQKLVEPCILAGCPEGGTVLDPFFGAGTVGLVATKLGRKYVGIELNLAYIEIAQKRIAAAKR